MHNARPSLFIFAVLRSGFRDTRCTCALLTIWLQRMFENGNIIPVYSPLVDRLGLGPRLVGRLGFSSTVIASFIFLMGSVDIGRRRAANVHASQHGVHGPGLIPVRAD